MLMRGGTKRDETRPTDGEIVSRTAGMLGKPLLPWQRYVADVAGETYGNLGYLSVADWMPAELIH